MQHTAYRRTFGKEGRANLSKGAPEHLFPGPRPGGQGVGTILRQEIKQNRLQLPSEQKIACVHRLGLGLASNYSLRRNKRIACFRWLGLGLAFNQLPEHFHPDPDRYLVGKSNKIIYSFLQDKKKPVSTGSGWARHSSTPFLR